MGFFDHVTVSLNILCTANQVTELVRSAYSIKLVGTSCLSRPSKDVLCAGQAVACGY